MTPEHERQRLVLAALAHFRKGKSPIQPSDLENLMAKCGRVVQASKEVWYAKYPTNGLIYSPPIDVITGFFVQDLLYRFSTFDKDELLHIIVIAHVQQMVYDIAGSTENVTGKIIT